MCTRRVAIAILSAIAILIPSIEAEAQTNLFDQYRSLIHIDRDLNYEDINNGRILTLMGTPPERPSEPIVNEAVLDLEASSDSHDWSTVNNWLLSGLPRGTPTIDPSLNLRALSVDRDQFLCLATNIYFEARGSSLDDQRAVALVTINRARHWRWRGAICDVVWERSQFSWTIWANQPRNRVRTVGSWQTSQMVAYEVLRGQIEDITGGSTNYYNPSVVNPSWARLAVQSQRIGAHRYLVLRTTRDYDPPANMAGVDLNRMYSTAIRSIMRQMRIVS